MKWLKLAKQKLIFLPLLLVLGFSFLSYFNPAHTSQAADKDNAKLKIKKDTDNKYSLKSLSNDLVELGTEKGAGSSSKPFLKLNKWDNEIYLKISIPFDVASEDFKTSENKVTYTTVDNKKVEFLSKAPEEITEKDSKGNNQKYTINEDGGVEFDTILEEKPVSNQIIFPIEIQNLDFFYQPPLNEEIKDPNLTCTETTCTDKDGQVVNFRPENVVGSYAVYYKDGKSGDFSKMGGKNYKTGKAFHIYRPKIWDSAGKQIYGNLAIEQSNNLTITIPQSFLDSASYPVTIDPNFGYETVGSTTEQIGGQMFPLSNTRGSLFTGAAGTATSITAYTNRTDGGSTSKSGIYLHSNSTLITNGATNETTVGTASSWVAFSFATQPTIEAVDYVLVLAHSMPPFEYGRWMYDAGAIDQGHFKDGYLASPATFTHTTNKYSIYATYTAGGGNSAPTNDSLTFTNPYTGGSNNAVADNTTEWNFRAVVSDTDGYANLGTVVLRLANSSDNTTPYDSLKFTWTEATDAFSETADTQNAATITSTGANSTCVTNTCTLDFKIKFNSSFSTQSTNYNAELYTTDDAAATDEDSYANFYQVVPISISISSPADVSLGTITGTGTSSTGEATWTVTTNNPSGYKLEWQASSATMANAYSDTIAAYTPAVADTPETWNVATTDSEWGGRLKSTSTDYASGTWGTDDTTNAKWLNVKSSAVFQIASRASTTTGSNEIVQFKAEVGSSKFQPTGTYTVNVTLTATTL